MDVLFQHFPVDCEENKYFQNGSDGFSQNSLIKCEELIRLKKLSLISLIVFREIRRLHGLFKEDNYLREIPLRNHNKLIKSRNNEDIHQRI
jgi:hypothetical protein